MSAPASITQAGGIAAIVAVAALGAVTISGGGGASSAPAPAPASQAAFDPAKVTVVAQRDWRPRRVWDGERAVRIRAKQPQAVELLAKRATAQLSSADGDQLSVTLTNVVRSGREVRADVRADEIPRAGEYTGRLSLDPLADKAAAVEVTVKARHHWLWPFCVLLLGVVTGVGGTWLYEARRRQMLLRNALTEAGAWLQRTPKVDGLFDLPGELIGRGAAALGTGRCRDQTKPLPKLLCEISRTWADDELDARATAIEELRGRCELWYRAADAARRLEAAQAAFGAEVVVRHTTALLAQLATRLELADDGVVQRLDAQADVVEALRAARAAWLAAGEPADSNPLDVYGAFAGADERTAEQSSQLVGRLRELALRLQAQGGVPIAGVAPAFRGGRRMLPPVLLSASRPADELAPPPWLPGGEAGADVALRRTLRTFDLVVFVAHLAIAGMAFLLPVYTATNFGTPAHYLAMFTAGFLGKLVLDQSVGLVRSVRLAPGAAAETPAVTAPAA